MRVTQDCVTQDFVAVGESALNWVTINKKRSVNGLSGVRTLVAGIGLALSLATGTALAQNGQLTFLHFNDVYDIGANRTSGGMAPLTTLLKQERERARHAITTLGGDFISPSLLSGILHGSQMIDILNGMKVDVAGFGNHEFDFGADVAAARLKDSEFPWLGTNVLGPDGQPFAGANAVWTRQVGDIKVGLFGLLTTETTSLATVGPKVTFADPIPTAKAAVERLRAEGAHVIVALTHMTMQEDRALATAVPGISVILGGHNHEAMSLYEGETLIFKSGQNASYLGVIDLDVRTTQGRKGPVTSVTPASWRHLSTSNIADDPEIAARIAPYSAGLDASMNEVIATLTADLDSRQTEVRAREATMGNLITDALRHALNADVAMINGGAIRANILRPAGSNLTRRDIFAELPFGNIGILVEMTGESLRRSLEMAVSQVETGAGRFPQVSGMSFAYNPKAPVGQRLHDISVGGKPLDSAAIYRVATTDYLLRGGDGSNEFEKARLVIAPNDGRLLATLVMDHVASLKTLSPKVEGRIRIAE